MYIGVWPEYHLAKIVAQAEEVGKAAKEGAAGPPPEDAAAAFLGEALSQASICRRVDLDDGLPASDRRFNVGPGQLSAVQRSSAEGRRKAAQASPATPAGPCLPPLARPASGSRSGSRAGGRGSGRRAHSQPRLWQPPLPGEGAGAVGGGGCRRARDLRPCRRPRGCLLRTEEGPLLAVRPPMRLKGQLVLMSGKEPTLRAP